MAGGSGGGEGGEEREGGREGMNVRGSGLFAGGGGGEVASRRVLLKAVRWLRLRG